MDFFTEKSSVVSLSGMIIGVVLAAAILLLGTLLADSLKQRGSELVVQQVFQNNGVAINHSENKLLQSKTMALLREYIIAFLDAAIRFDTVPKFDTRTIYSLATALPEGVEVQNISFRGYHLVLACQAGSEAEYTMFITRLRQSGVFEAVSTFGMAQAKDGLIFRLECAPKVSQGELNFAREEDARLG